MFDFAEVFRQLLILLQSADGGVQPCLLLAHRELVLPPLQRLIPLQYLYPGLQRQYALLK